MKMLKLIFILMIPFVSSAQKRGLLYIVEADRSMHIDKDSKRRVFPKLHLSITRDDSVFLYDKMIYYKKTLPSEGLSVFYEIYDSHILFVTYRGSDQLGMSDPLFLKRNNVCIIDLKKPGKIYHVDFLQKRLVSNQSIFNRFKGSGELVSIISDINFSQQLIRLKSTSGKIDSLKLNFINQ